MADNISPVLDICAPTELLDWCQNQQTGLDVASPEGMVGVWREAYQHAARVGLVEILDEIKPGSPLACSILRHGGELRAKVTAVLSRMIDACSCRKGTKSPIRLLIDVKTSSVTLDGKKFSSLDPDAFRVFQLFADNPSTTLTTKELLKKLPNCHHDTTLRRWLNKLPDPLRLVIGVQKGPSL